MKRRLTRDDYFFDEDFLERLGINREETIDIQSIELFRFKGASSRGIQKVRITTLVEIDPENYSVFTTKEHRPLESTAKEGSE